MNLINDFFGMPEESANLFLFGMIVVACLAGLFAHFVSKAPLPGDKEN